MRWAILICLCFASVAPPQEPTFRAAVTLVQVDVIATGADGKQVADLKAEDFRLVADGQPRQLTHCTYVATRLAPVAAAPSAPLVPVRLEAKKVGRSIAFVLDDLSLSRENLVYVRAALKQFLDREMQPNDLVAFLRSGKNVSALQQFTNDKRILYAALAKLNFVNIGRSNLDMLAMRSELTLNRELYARSKSGMDQMKVAQSESETITSELGDEIYSLLTVGALTSTVEGLRELPGRKSMVVFSDGMRFTMEVVGDKTTSRKQQLEEAVDRLTATANRAAVTIYTVNSRGLVSPRMDLAGSTQDVVLEGEENWNSGLGLSVVAGDTGGRYMQNSNDMASLVSDILEDEAGYYLLAYPLGPDEQIAPPHSVKLQVTRPGVHLRYRRRVYAPEAPPSGGQNIATALLSPFGATDLPVRLTSLFAYDAKKGPLIHALAYLDAREVGFSRDASGGYRASLDVQAGLFADDGTLAYQASRTYSLALSEAGYQDALKQGLVFSSYHPVKKPGAYQFRLALRDSSSGKVGSANQFVEIPDVPKGALTLSGIMISPEAPAAALRIFKPGQELPYVYDLFNSGAGVKTQIRVFCNGREKLIGSWTPVQVLSQIAPKQLRSGGVLALGDKAEPGDYILQVLASEEARQATQWIDFEIRN